jgi:hypothetical protein
MASSLFIGALGLFAYQMLKAGATVKQLWQIWAIIAVADIPLEVPLQLVNRRQGPWVPQRFLCSTDEFGLSLVLCCRDESQCI